MLIQLTTYGYVYYEDPIQAQVDDPVEYPIQAFVTVKKGIDVTKLAKQLSETFEQPIVLTLENEFEIDCLEEDEKLNPLNDSIYASREMQGFMANRRKPLVFTEELLDVGTIIIHPALGKGEIAGYAANDYAKYDEVRRPAPSFYYVVAFEKDAYLDEEGKTHQPKRNFEPSTLHSILRWANAQ